MPATKLNLPNSTKTRFIASLFALALVAIAIPTFASDPQPNAQAPSAIATIPTIPATSYAVPSNSIFVNQSTGNVNNSGTSGSPLPTLAAAISKAKDGDTIVISSGIYREGNLSFWKRLTIQPAQGAQVWFDGTTLTSGWVSDSAGGYKLANSPSANLCTAGTGCLDAADQVTASSPMAWSPQMVFVNDVLLNEVDTRAKAASGNNFFYDIPTNTLFIGVNPTGKKVEVATQRKFLDLTSPTATIRGIGIRRYGSILSPAKVQGSYHGAALQVSQGGSGRPTNVTIENNVFFQNASRGMSVSYTDTPNIRGNQFLSNGSNGFDIFQTNAPLIEKNLIRGNNAEHFNSGSGESSVIAGSKMVKVYDGVVKDNVFEFNDGTGVWCDLACTGMKYYRNNIHDNAKHGIFYELSDNGTIASNAIYNNGGNGVKLNGSNTKVINNTFHNNFQNIALYEDPRTPPNDPYANTRSNVVVNNILSGTSGGSNSKNDVGAPIKLLEVNGFNNADSVAPHLMVTELDYNAYYRSSASNPQPAVAVGWRGSSVSKTFSSIASAKAEPATSNGFKLEPNGYGEDGGIKPLFVDAAKFNFNLATGSSAIGSGKLLSGSLSYIAQDLGLNPTSTINRGAIAWQGKTTTPSTTIPPLTAGTNPSSTVVTTTTPPTTIAPPTTIPMPTTTVAPTTTAPPVTAPPKVESAVDIAVRKIMADYDLQKVKIYSWNDPYLRARLFLKSSGFLYLATDSTISIDKNGNYQIVSVNWIVNFGPIA